MPRVTYFGDSTNPSVKWRIVISIAWNILTNNVCLYPQKVQSRIIFSVGTLVRLAGGGGGHYCTKLVLTGREGYKYSTVLYFQTCRWNRQRSLRILLMTEIVYQPIGDTLK